MRGAVDGVVGDCCWALGRSCGGWGTARLESWKLRRYEVDCTKGRKEQSKREAGKK